MTRVQRLAVTATLATLFQVAWGAFTRGSGSGYGCRDRWPLCEGGLLQIGDAGGLLPRPEFEMVVEWLHRWIALAVLALLVWLAVAARRRYPRLRRITWPAAGAVVVVVGQSLLGAAVVITDLDADLVTVHLVGAVTLLGLLTYLTVNTFFVGAPEPDHRGRPRSRAAATGERRWRRLVVLAGVGTILTLVLGSSVHNEYVGGWPLVGGQLVPDTLGESTTVDLHYAHRLLAGLTFGYLVWLAAVAVRRGRPRPEVVAVHTALGLFLVNVGLGAVHVVTEVSSVVAIVAHLGVGAAAWAAVVAAWTLARRRYDRTPPAGPDDDRPAEGALEVGAAA